MGTRALILLENDGDAVIRWQSDHPWVGNSTVRHACPNNATVSRFPLAVAAWQGGPAKVSHTGHDASEPDDDGGQGAHNPAKVNTGCICNTSSKTGDSDRSSTGCWGFEVVSIGGCVDIGRSRWAEEQQPISSIIALRF